MMVMFSEVVNFCVVLSVLVLSTKATLLSNDRASREFRLLQSYAHPTRNQFASACLVARWRKRIWTLHLFLPFRLLKFHGALLIWWSIIWWLWSVFVISVNGRPHLASNIRPALFLGGNGPFASFIFCPKELKNIVTCTSWNVWGAYLSTLILSNVHIL